jgi:hypothetical protein
MVLGISVTVAESSFAPVKGAVNGVCLLLQIADQEQVRAADFLKQLDRIAYQTLRVAEVQKQNSVDVGDLLLEKCRDLLTATVRFFRATVVYFRHANFFSLGKTILLDPKMLAY